MNQSDLENRNKLEEIADRNEFLLRQIQIAKMEFKRKSAEIKKQIEIINAALAKKFKAYGISRFNLTSVGNSIATGFSMLNRIGNPFNRVKDTQHVFLENGIELSKRGYATAGDNTDEETLNRLLENTTQRMIHEYNVSDVVGPYSIKTRCLEADTIETEYSTEVEDDIGLFDLIKQTEASLANIIVYSGATGSMIDNQDKQGHKKLPPIKRDLVSIEAILKIIQNNNRDNNGRTQVYLCGAPDYLGTGLVNIPINNQLKAIAGKYAFVTYVEPVKSKVFYSDGKGGKAFDAHYDEIEYLQYVKNVMGAINDSFFIKDILVDIDRKLYQFSKLLKRKNRVLDDSLTKGLILREINAYYKKVIQLGIDPNAFTRILFSYFGERYCHDFYHATKEEMIVTEVNNKLKR